MADGKDHMLLWVESAPILALGSGTVLLIGDKMLQLEPWMDANYWPYACAGIFLAGFMGPDRDMMQETEEESVIMAASWPLGFVSQAFFAPYAAMFRHRALWTHSPIVGTLIRVVYSTVVIALLAAGWVAWCGGWRWLDAWVVAARGWPAGSIAVTTPYTVAWLGDLVRGWWEWTTSHGYETLWYLLGLEIQTWISHYIPDYTFVRPFRPGWLKGVL